MRTPYRSLLVMLWNKAGWLCCSVAKSHVFVSPWTAARQNPLSVAISGSLFKFMAIESMMPSNHLVLCHPLVLLPSVFPRIRVFSSESVLHIRWLKYWSFSFSNSPPMTIQDWFPLGLTGWISLVSNGPSREFSSTTVWKHQFFSAQPSYIHTWLQEKP